MDNKISHDLMALGFFSALGTSEHPGMIDKEIHVKRGTPHTFDSNNGVTVVYDEDGRPWITSKNYGGGIESLREANHWYALQRGAYVPHSNDGGHFVHEVIDKL